MQNFSKAEMIEELKYYLTDNEILELNNDIKKIKKIFYDVIEKNSQEITADYLINNLNENYVLINTPDGWNAINDYYVKERNCVKIILENDLELECSVDHKIETAGGWKFANDLSIYDLILTSKGFIKFKEKKELEFQKVYDFEVNHINHRYWANNISSHNTGKTILSCYYAISSLIKHKYERIIFTKPIEESGEHLGFLPGDIADKINPYIESYKGNLLKFINKATYEKLINDEVIEYKPLAFMRGTTHSQSLAVLDEAQNCDLRQLMLFITRMGKNSKVIISGDISQYDIKHNTIGLLKFTEMVKDIPNLAVFNFEKEDIMRDPILIEIVDRYEKLKYSNAPKK